MARFLRRWSSGIIFAIAIPTVLALGACGGGDPESTVSVELSEFKIAVDLVSVPKGKVTFNMENIGEIEHELMLIRTSGNPDDPPLAPDALPLAEGGGIADSEVEVIGRIHPAFGPGSATATIGMDPGRYILICNIVSDSDEGDPLSHYEEGERAAFAVTLP